MEYAHRLGDSDEHQQGPPAALSVPAIAAVEASMDSRSVRTQLLIEAGRLLLEYNESTGGIHRALKSVAASLGEERCHIRVSYGNLAVAIGDEAPAERAVREIRYNTALQVRVHSILARVRSRELPPEAALSELRLVEERTPRHARWLAAVMLAAAAAALAALLGADPPGALVAALASGVGLVVRQELARRSGHPLLLPLCAAAIGGLLGGLAIRWNWTATPAQVLLTPALMLVPGPHLINGLLDLIDNHVSMGLARMGLAAGILAAGALGVVVGMELTLPVRDMAARPAAVAPISLAFDMLLAGVVASGFAVFYNTTWREVGLAALGGMVGHSVRYLALDAGVRLDVAAFLGGFAVGLTCALLSRREAIPLAVISFAGAVTMIPGLQIYLALSSALHLASLGEAAAPAEATAMLVNAIQASLVVGGLALGLIGGERLALALAHGRKGSPGAPASV